MCESVLQTSNWEPRYSKNNPKASVWTNCWGAQKLGQLCYLLTVSHNRWLIIQLVCTNMMNCFKIKIRQRFYYANPRTRQPRPLFHMQDTPPCYSKMKVSREREIKDNSLQYKVPKTRDSLEGCWHLLSLLIPISMDSCQDSKLEQFQRKKARFWGNLPVEQVA